MTFVDAFVYRCCICKQEHCNFVERCGSKKVTSTCIDDLNFDDPFICLEEVFPRVPVSSFSVLGVFCAGICRPFRACFL